jgi:CRISPR-associated protein Csd1
MMLRALYDLAMREKLVETPGFSQGRVDFVISIDRTGGVLGLVPTQDDQGRPKRFEIPTIPSRTVKVVAGVLVDNAKYVLGLQPPAEDTPSKAQEAKASARASAMTAAFRANVEALALACDEGAAAVLGFLDDLERSKGAIFRERAAGDWSGSEVLAFQLEGDEGFVHQRPAIRSKLIAAAGAAEEAAGLCLVTGQRAPIARTHDVKVKGLPGQQTSGAALVTFNSPAFESHGLEQGANASVGKEASIAYATAINWLLQSVPGRRHRQGVGLGNSVLVFWTREPDPTADLLCSLFDPSPDDLRNVLESPLRGLEPGELDAGAFYAVTLSAHSRVLVRDWLETTTGEVKRSLKQYWADLELDGGEGRPRPVFRLLQSLAAPGREGLPPGAAAEFFRSALTGAALPREVLGAALRRIKLPSKENDRFLLHDRCSLVKAVLTRQLRKSQRKELTVALDPSNHQTAYLLGRLFAVLERLQGAALGDVNATIRDRFFASASSTPALVFPRLLKMSIHHASKSGAGWLEREKAQVIDALAAAPLPSSLNLEDQGLFAVGYYHQRQELWRPKPKTEAPLPQDKEIRE